MVNCILDVPGSNVDPETDRPSELRCLGATLKVGQIRYRVNKGYIKINCKLFYLMNLQKLFEMRFFKFSAQFATL